MYLVFKAHREIKTHLEENRNAMEFGMLAFAILGFLQPEVTWEGGAKLMFTMFTEVINQVKSRVIFS